ncbi:MAG: erythromycin esterase family protein [Betaproteobacteria bacterium]
MAIGPALAASGPDGPTAAPARASIGQAIRRVAHPIAGLPQDYDRLLEAIGGARIVLLGEDTHGTREFYQARALLTRRLIAERGFSGVVIEADGPDAASLSGYLGGHGDATDAGLALDSFQRFPRWMWRNTDFRDFLEWLRSFNLRRDTGRGPVIVHGMDLYEIAQSITQVIDHLESVNPAAAASARSRYACFAASGYDVQRYGAVVAVTPGADCSAAAQEVTADLAAGVHLQAGTKVNAADPAHFQALQAARAVRGAEEYFRILHTQPDEAWNYRDRHMADMVDALLTHLDAAGDSRSRIVIWAHNAHVGDARATSRGALGYLTVGQLLRERHGDNAFLVGFTTATGTVRAATDWGGPDLVKRLLRPLAGSHAAIFHSTGLQRFYLFPQATSRIRRFLDQPRPQRGVGVRYLPELELAGHYYRARLSSQFDAVVHFDRTTALVPLAEP